MSRRVTAASARMMASSSSTLNAELRPGHGLQQLEIRHPSTRQRSLLDDLRLAKEVALEILKPERDRLRVVLPGLDLFRQQLWAVSGHPANVLGLLFRIGIPEHMCDARNIGPIDVPLAARIPRVGREPGPGHATGGVHPCDYRSLTGERGGEQGSKVLGVVTVLRGTCPGE